MSILTRSAPANRSILQRLRAVGRTARYWVPLLIGFMCFVAVQSVGPVVGLILLVLGFGLVFDGTSALWVRAGSGGNLRSHRQ